MQTPGNDYRTIPLTQGQFAIVDAEDFERISIHKWCAALDKKTGSYYAIRTETTSIPNSKRLTIRMHREILGLRPGCRTYGDHINGDTLDCRKQNLRPATKLQNNENRRVRKDSSSGLKGIRFHKPSGKWQARINFQGTRIHLGYFPIASDAHAAYCAAAKEYYGEFARMC